MRRSRVRKVYFASFLSVHFSKVRRLPSALLQPNNQHKMKPNADYHIRLQKCRKHKGG